MSEPNSQGEPTMEEILASIRKIISEDGPEAEAAGEAEAAETTEAPAAQPEEATPAEEPAEASPAAAAEEDEDVLDLTQEVKEDGTVVDLKAKRDGAAEAMPVTEPEPEPEEPADLELSDDALADEPPAPREEPEPEPLEVEEPVAQMPEPEPEPEPAMAAAAAAPQAEGSGLLANQTRDAATASLVELAMTAGLGAGGREGTAGASGQTLEMLVREALRPYLKSWLDENLAPLVERIVREEIQKMVKRAEYR